MFSILVFLLVLTPSILAQNPEWDYNVKNQYHIQTDEGPERYFRYETLSGQYRKEKRLEDGSVVGTYAWIDGDGVLHQRDYIADNEGYRILRSKKIFVGNDVTIGKAVKGTKKVPAQAGTLVKSDNNKLDYSNAGKIPSVKYDDHATPTHFTTIASPTLYTSEQPPPFSSTVSPIKVEISSIAPPTVPAIYSSVTPSSEETIITPKPIPAIYTQPPYSDVQENNYLPPAPANVNYLPPSQVSASSDEYSAPPHRYFFNGPTYPISTKGQIYNGVSNNIQENQSQNNYYDGVSVTNDGFRYYIPRAYHAEQTLPNDERSGSFGYIDPFGIRRVVYYNATPGKGFQHRKNNRYVGFNAPPYDPVPPY